MKIQEYLTKIKEAKDRGAIRRLGAVGNLTMGADCAFEKIYDLLMKSPDFQLVHRDLDSRDAEDREYGKACAIRRIDKEFRERRRHFTDLLELEVGRGRIKATEDVKRVIKLGGGISEESYLELCGRTSVYPQDDGGLHLSFRFGQKPNYADLMVASGDASPSRRMYLEGPDRTTDPEYPKIKYFLDNHNRHTLTLGPSVGEEVSRNSLVRLVEGILMPNRIPFMLGPLALDGVGEGGFRERGLSAVPIFDPKED